jgi:hypothetical protein
MTFKHYTGNVLVAKGLMTLIYASIAFIFAFCIINFLGLLGIPSEQDYVTQQDSLANAYVDKNLNLTKEKFNHFDSLDQTIVSGFEDCVTSDITDYHLWPLRKGLHIAELNQIKQQCGDDWLAKVVLVSGKAKQDQARKIFETFGYKSHTKQT